MLRPITIAGGGLAGLALGMHLRQRGVPVEIWEAAGYPRHRVCGEFVCGAGVRLLQELNVLPPKAFHVPKTVQFFHQRAESKLLQIPGPALAIPRFTLDQALATAFRDQGGTLHTRSRWTGSLLEPGVVRATGRPAASNGKFRLIGVKVHASDIDLTADVELHFSSKGYVGLSRLPQGKVNICSLIRTREPIGDIRTCFAPRLAELLNPTSRSRILKADFDPDSLSVVAGISLGPPPPDVAAQCRIGDSIGMIAPLSGNGMSIAFESAALAAPHLASYSAGDIPWAAARAKISRDCEKQFSNRTRSARFLQNCLFSAPAQTLLLSGLNAFQPLFKWLFKATRS